MEKENDKKRKEEGFEKGELRNIILGTIGFAGLLSLALFAPNTVQLLKLFRHRHRRYHSPAHLRKVVENLRKRGYIIIRNSGENEKLVLTEKGARELSRYRIKQQKSKKPKKWDKKWRIIIFDIPEKKRGLRNRIRQNIQEFGFYKLQHSVWVYPHECEELITLLKADCKIGKEILYIIAQDVEGEEYLKKHFKLKT